MYSKPFSMRLVASITFLATLQVYSSLPSSRICVYRSVVRRSLCPSRALTYSRSLVLWYSIEALKCRKS